MKLPLTAWTTLAFVPLVAVKAQLTYTIESCADLQDVPSPLTEDAEMVFTASPVSKAEEYAPNSSEWITPTHVHALPLCV